MLSKKHFKFIFSTSYFLKRQVKLLIVIDSNGLFLCNSLSYFFFTSMHLVKKKKKDLEIMSYAFYKVILIIVFSFFLYSSFSVLFSCWSEGFGCIYLTNTEYFSSFSFSFHFLSFWFINNFLRYNLCRINYTDLKCTIQ